MYEVSRLLVYRSMEQDQGAKNTIGPCAKFHAAEIAVSRQSGCQILVPMGSQRSILLSASTGIQSPIKSWKAHRTFRR
jgi:hypothetical protein